MSSVSTLEAERLLPDEYDRGRLALGFDYDEDTISTLKNADWDVLHQDWRPSYEFKSGREGAWVVDCTDEALDYLEDRIRPLIPPLRDVPYAIDSDIKLLSSGPVERECSECGSDGLLSETGARSVYSSGAVWIQPLIDSNKATHVCSSCHALFRRIYSNDQTTDSVDTDPTELMNTTPEQRARYLERAHDDLREPEAEALAYREAGWSHTGIASQIDKNPGTVKSYLRDIGEKYGLEALETKSPGERVGPLGGEK